MAIGVHSLPEKKSAHPRANFTLLVKPTRTPKSASLKIGKKMALEVVFASIVFNCLARLQAQEDSIVQTYVPESVHQARIALRRLRLTITVFMKYISIPRELKEEVKWLSEKLGAARDWDVLTMEILPALREHGVIETSYPRLLQVAQEMCEKKHRLAAACLSSQRYILFNLNCLLWLHSRGWRDYASKPQRKCAKQQIADVMPKIFKMLHRQLHHQVEKHGEDELAKLHKVRIAAKNIRYATDIFLPLLPTKKAHVYLTKITRVQNQLGDIHDVASVDNLVQDLIVNHSDLADLINCLRTHWASSLSLKNQEIDKLLKKMNKIGSPY